MLKIESAGVVVAAALKDEKSAWQPERPSRLPSWGKTSIAQNARKDKTGGESVG